MVGVVVVDEVLLGGLVGQRTGRLDLALALALAFAAAVVVLGGVGIAVAVEGAVGAAVGVADRVPVAMGVERVALGRDVAVADPLAAGGVRGR